MTISNMKPISQKEFDVATLFLSEKADHEIEINDNNVEGIIYIAINDENNWIGFDFKAGITKSFKAGELWKDEYGTHCIEIPTLEIDDVVDINVSYNDSGDIDNNELNIDYTSRIDDIKEIVSDFIYDKELVAPNKYDIYNV